MKPSHSVDKMVIITSDNDEYGNPAGVTRHLQVADGINQILLIEPKTMEPVYFKATRFTIRTGGIRVRYIKKAPWVGSVTMNAYTLEAGYGLGLLNAMMRSGKWTATDGFTELFEKWEKMKEFTAGDFGYTEPLMEKVIIPNQLKIF